jgi:hypothetical protein
MKSALRIDRRAGPAVGLALVLVIAAGAPASARILKTRRLGQPGQGLALTIGSGFEYETDPEESEFGYPFLLEYEMTRALKLSVEPSYVQIRSKPGERGTSVSGSGDLETTVEYEFLSERRYRPALTFEGIVKWPAAAHEEIGTHEMDYSLGLIVSKEFVGFDVDLNALYTFVGSPPGVELQNATEVSFASEWHLRPALDLEGEVVTSTGGGIRGQSGTLGGVGGRAGSIGPSENLTEGTLGLAVHLNDYLKLEQGLVAKSDGSWQFVFAWEWDFTGR